MYCSAVNIKTGRSLFLHRIVGRSKKYLYFFSYEIIDSISLPEGFEVLRSKSGQPYVKKKGRGAWKNEEF